VDAYITPLVINPVIISATASPLTFCTSDNGEVFATIANDNKFEYDFFWSIGTVNKPVADYTGNLVGNLPAGDYTAFAIDRLDPFCVSDNATVTIKNEQVFPSVTALMVRPLTICDPARPDAVAAATVGGDIVHYFFDWFTGTSTTGVSFYRGVEAGDLTNTTYTVQASDMITGCTGTTQVTITTDFAVIPDPTVTLVSNVTSCIEDNGELSTTVAGVQKDYIFDWTDGATASTPSDFVGDIYRGIPAGSYTVVATSIITGCKSRPVTAPVIIDQVFPDLEFIVEKSTCDQNPPDGSISLLFDGNSTLGKIEWFKDGAKINEGPNVSEITAGDYEVTAATLLGCETTESVNVPVEVVAYNGVSRRKDGLNDTFIIGCIEAFENNRVEIFNRQGTKVYEGIGYNNNEIVFDGKSNHGISILGTDLPAGTYYYVITKGDGSEKVIGYLELVN